MFEPAFHMSMAELRWASFHTGYRIGRVSALTATSAEIRILTGITDLAKHLLKGLKSVLPDGVNIDSVEIPSTVLQVIHEDRLHVTEE